MWIYHLILSSNKKECWLLSVNSCNSSRQSQTAHTITVALRTLPGFAARLIQTKIGQRVGDRAHPEVTADRARHPRYPLMEFSVQTLGCLLNAYLIEAVFPWGALTDLADPRYRYIELSCVSAHRGRGGGRGLLGHWSLTWPDHWSPVTHTSFLVWPIAPLPHHCHWWQQQYDRGVGRVQQGVLLGGALT